MWNIVLPQYTYMIFMCLVISISFSLLFGERSVLPHKNAAKGSNIHFLPLGHGFEMCLTTDYISYLLSGRRVLPACLPQRGQTPTLSENVQGTGVASTWELFVVTTEMAANIQEETDRCFCLILYNLI